MKKARKPFVDVESRERKKMKCMGRLTATEDLGSDERGKQKLRLKKSGGEGVVRENGMHLRVWRSKDGHILKGERRGRKGSGPRKEKHSQGNRTSLYVR